MCLSAIRPLARARPLPEVGDRIRDRRQSLDMSVRELARRLTLSPSLISQIELGSATPSVGTLYAIINELNMSLDELFLEEPARALAGGRGRLTPRQAADGPRSSTPGRRTR